MQHLLPADVQRLHLIMLSLHRAQQQRHVHLPPDLLRMLYGFCAVYSGMPVAAPTQ